MSKYHDDFPKMLIEHMENGLSYLSFAGKIRVAFKTLYEWEKEYPEFKEAKEIGLSLSLLWDEALLNKGTEGKQRGYNAASHKWKMTNRYKWSDRSEVEYKTTEKMDLDELKKEAARLLQDLNEASN